MCKSYKEPKQHIRKCVKSGIYDNYNKQKK